VRHGQSMAVLVTAMEPFDQSIPARGDDHLLDRLVAPEIGLAELPTARRACPALLSSAEAICQQHRHDTRYDADHAHATPPVRWPKLSFPITFDIRPVPAIVW